MRLPDIPHPTSATAERAREVLTHFASPALVNHSLRSFVWAAAYGIDNDIAFDAELLYVAAMVHDLGLVPAFDAHAVDFEVAGGNVAWVFGAGAGWSEGRRQRVAEVVVRHMHEAVDVEIDPEGFLLEIATALDITGRNPQWWSEELRSEVVNRYPRLDLQEQFTACFAAEAARKPESSAARAMRGGLAEGLAANPLDG